MDREIVGSALNISRYRAMPSTIFHPLLNCDHLYITMGWMRSLWLIFQPPKTLLFASWNTSIQFIIRSNINFSIHSISLVFQFLILFNIYYSIFISNVPLSKFLNVSIVTIVLFIYLSQYSTWILQHSKILFIRIWRDTNW